MRSGRTSNLIRRQMEHVRDPIMKDFSFEAVYRADVRAEQRG